MPGRYEFSLPERPVRDGWLRIGSLDVTTTAGAVMLGVASMIVWAVDKATVLKLIYVGPLVRDGAWWRVLTWPVANPPTEIFVVFTLAFFWFVGHRIEDLVGKKRFAALLAAMTVLPAAVVSLFDFTAATGQAYGLGVLGTALLVIYALEYPNVLFFFNIPAWIIAAVLVLIHVLQLLGDRAWGMLGILLGAILVAVVGARWLGLLGDVPALSMIGAQRRHGGTSRRRQDAVARRGDRRSANVIAGPWAGGSAVTSTSAADQAALDTLLDKIASGGMDSLTREEKSQLNELSKRLRDR